MYCLLCLDGMLLNHSMGATKCTFVVFFFVGAKECVKIYEPNICTPNRMRMTGLAHVKYISANKSIRQNSFICVKALWNLSFEIIAVWRTNQNMYDQNRFKCSSLVLRYPNCKPTIRNTHFLHFSYFVHRQFGSNGYQIKHFLKKLNL